MESELLENIRILIGKHGIKAVHQAIEKEAKEVYEYIEQVLSKRVISKVVEKKPEVILSEEVEVKRDVKMTKEESKKKREKHEADIVSKRKEYESKGIQPESLLTRENLSNWLNEGKTYWEIAEVTGCKDLEISVKAKSFGLQSKMSKFIIAKRAVKSKE